MRLTVRVSIADQRLYLESDQQVLASYSVSTAKNGVGEQEGSGCTPRGEHEIAEKIGQGADPYSVFIARQQTGEIYSSVLAVQHPERDWILTRILWLRGCEPGFNLGGQVDSFNRYIYIHGTPDTEPMGIPRSKGCIRMRNSELIELFDKVEPGTRVRIEA